MKMKTKYIIISLFAALSFTSCSDFLKEYSQDEDYIRSWKDLNELLLGDCYLENNYPANFGNFANKGMFIHLLTDEMEENNVGGSRGDVGTDSHTRTFAFTTWQPRLGMKENYSDYFTENHTWKEFYKKINIANNIVASAANVPQSTAVDKEGVNKVVGEALFIRGFLYFWLTNTWGQPYNPATANKDLGVPVKTSEIVEDIIFERKTVQQCYDQILSDLLSAEDHLSKVTTPRKTFYRADVTSVQLLLSRVYLYMQNWEKAAEYAQKVIDAHPALVNMREVSGPFMTASNPENIFSMGGDDVYRMIALEYQCTRIAPDYYKCYTLNDIRRQKWFWTYQDFVGMVRREDMYPDDDKTPDQFSYHTYHYHQTASSHRSPVSSIFWLRSSEAYLNLAEAEAYMGHDEKAQAALRTFAANRYKDSSPEAAVTEIGSDLISRIRLEQRLEFPCEGHRWFDLRRYRVCKVQPEKISISHQYTLYRDNSSFDMVESRMYVLTEDDPSWTCPIPNEVIEYNTGMPGNGNVDRPYTIVATPSPM